MKHKIKISPYFYFGLLKRGTRIHYIVVHKYFHAGEITVKVFFNRVINTTNIKARNLLIRNPGELFKIHSILSLERFTTRSDEFSVT